MRAVAHVILLVDNCYVLQLRDNKPNIAAPGKWSLFGGMVESGESPREALVREIQEELSIKLSNFRPFWVVNRFSDFLQDKSSSVKRLSLFMGEFACAIVYLASSTADKYSILSVTFPSTTFL